MFEPMGAVQFVSWGFWPHSQTPLRRAGGACAAKQTNPVCLLLTDIDVYKFPFMTLHTQVGARTPMRK